MNFNLFFISLFLSVFFLYQQAYSAENGLVTEKKVQEKIDSVDDIIGLDEEGKKNILDIYAKTLEYLELLKVYEHQASVYIDARKNAPKEIKQLKSKLAALDKQQEQNKTPDQDNKQKIKELKDVSLSELEQKLNSELATLSVMEEKNLAISQSLNNESGSSPEIRKRLLEANQTLEQLLEDKKLPPAGDITEVKNSEQWFLDAQIAALRAEIKKLDLQLLSQSNRLKLLKLKKDLSDHHLKNSKVHIRFLEQQVNLKRSTEIKKAQELTRVEQIKSQGKHQLIQSLAHSNSSLSEDITKKTQELSRLEVGDDEVNKESKRLFTEQASTKKKLEIAGLNQILGQVLLKHKKALPDRKLYKKNLKMRENLLAQSGLQHIRYQDELNKIKDKREYLALLMKDVPAEVQLQIRDDLADLIKTRKELLIKAINIHESYLKAISDLDYAEKKLLRVAASYSKLLDEHLFWLRSAALMNMENIKTIPQQAAYFLSPSRWLTFANEFLSMTRSSVESIPILLIILFLLIRKNRIKELLVNVGQKTKKIRNDSLLHTWKAILYTLLLSIPLPVLFWLAGWQLSTLPDLSPFTYGVANGMLIMVLPLFSLQVFRFMCFPGGLSEVHFKWSADLINGLRKEMRRLMATFLPAIFITTMLISKGESSINGGLGRLFILVTLVTFAIFFYRLLKPETGILHSVTQKKPKTLFARYQGFWLFVCQMFVVALMGLTIVGYVYTAEQLTYSLIYTVWLIFGLIIMQQVVVRWLLLTQRKYALSVAYEKLKAARELRQEKERQEKDRQEKELKEPEKSDKAGNIKANSQNEDSEANELEYMTEFEEPEIDMVSLSEESTKLLNLVLFIVGILGFVTIWSEVLPALGIFEKVQLWHQKGVVEGVEKLLPVTLGDLALAILIAVVTIAGAKQFPAIIEILLLQNLTITSGSRYTITTLSNYMIIGVGLFSIFNILGADWARFQWLFAALSVGIGFGLQEIVANFISGIILLLERPIRVGDYVCVGGNEGVVNRIRIRATTIMTWDRQELIVPNKEFITGQLLNLSLSDQSARLIIPVGVAYGSDIPKVRELLLETARDNVRVLEEPVPQVVFYNFGDNTLDLQLRCFIGNVAFRLKTISEINDVINDKFNAEGINIAFPQRDVHLDISQPIDVRIKGEAI